MLARIYRAKTSPPNLRMKRYYSPRIDWDLIPRLYREARKQGVPMTKLASDLIRHSLPPSRVAIRFGKRKHRRAPVRVPSTLRKASTLLFERIPRTDEALNPTAVTPLRANTAAGREASTFAL